MKQGRFEGLSGGGWIVVTALVGLSGCKSETKPPVEEGPGKAETTRVELLKAVSSCVQTSAREFQTVAGELKTATAALAAQPGADTRQAAREAFHRAMDAWQVLEMMQIGPAAPRAAPGGAELRDNIYSWPLVSRCAVEEQLVSRGYESASFPTTLVSRRGLHALEYLLFYEGRRHRVRGQLADRGERNVGGAAGRGARGAQARVRGGGGLGREGARGRAGGRVGRGEGELREDVRGGRAGQPGVRDEPGGAELGERRALLRGGVVKDKKLARPLGLRECSGDTCPELLESPFARRAKANIAANLVGYRRVTRGLRGGLRGHGVR